MSDILGDYYLNWNLGVVLSCLGFTTAVFGFASAQLGFYLRHYWAEDRSLLRSIVSIVWTLDLFHVVLYGYTMFYYLVLKHNDFFGQLLLPWTSHAQMVTNTCLIAIVQSFYLLRVWSLCKHPLVIGGLIILVLADLALGMVMMAHAVLATSVSAIATLSRFVVAYNAISAATDIAITATLVILLFTSRTTGSRSRRLIHRLIFYTINTGLLTSVSSLLSLITNTTVGETNIYVFFYYLSARLYTVSMIASLNAREGLRNHMAEATGITTIPHTMMGTDHESSMHMTTSKKHAVRLPPAVFIETSVETTHT